LIKVQRLAGNFGHFPKIITWRRGQDGKICIRLDAEEISDESGVSNWKPATIEVGLNLNAKREELIRRFRAWGVRSNHDPKTGDDKSDIFAEPNMRPIKYRASKQTSNGCCASLAREFGLRLRGSCIAKRGFQTTSRQGEFDSS
jgi:hypothetical protein